MGEKYRHFSREFKRDAVQLVTEKGVEDKVLFADLSPWAPSF